METFVSRLLNGERRKLHEYVLATYSRNPCLYFAYLSQAFPVNCQPILTFFLCQTSAQGHDHMCLGTAYFHKHYWVIRTDNSLPRKWRFLFPFFALWFLTLHLCPFYFGKRTFHVRIYKIFYMNSDKTRGIEKKSNLPKGNSISAKSF